MSKKKTKVDLVPEEQAATPPEAPTIQPSPVPTTYQIAAVTDNSINRHYVMLTVSTATGRSVYFLDPDVAKTVGEHLLRLGAATVNSELIVSEPG